MSKPKGLGGDPLADFLHPGPKPVGAAPAVKDEAPPAASPPKAQKERLSALLEVELVAEVKDAVLHLSGPMQRMTLTRFLTEALEEKLTMERKKAGVGERFPRYGQKTLPGGRPIGS